MTWLLETFGKKDAREPPIAAFTQLKPIPFLLKETTWITKNKCVKSIYIFLESLLAKEKYDFMIRNLLVVSI